MRNTTNRKKWGAILCAVVVIAFLSIYLAVILFPVVGAALGDTIGMIFLIVYGLIVVGIIVGEVLSLRQRLKELDSGQEEEAKQY